MTAPERLQTSANSVNPLPETDVMRQALDPAIQYVPIFESNRRSLNIAHPVVR
jgi:hypothetical protein